MNNRTLSMGYSLGMVEIYLTFLILCTRLFVYIIFECVSVCECVCTFVHV